MNTFQTLVFLMCGLAVFVFTLYMVTRRYTVPCQQCEQDAADNLRMIWSHQPASLTNLDEYNSDTTKKNNTQQHPRVDTNNDPHISIPHNSDSDASDSDASDSDTSDSDASDSDASNSDASD